MNFPSLLYELKPILIVLLLPPAPLLLLIVVGAGLLRQYRRTGRLVLASGLLGLWLSCSDGAGQWLALHLLKTPSALSPAAVEALRSQQNEEGHVAVLVLGGGARAFVPEYDDAGLTQLTLERLRYGIWLARRIGAPLGFSGGIGWGAQHLQVSEASVAERTAKEEYGLPLTWVEGQSRDTRENANLSVALLKADGINKLVLVTQDMHMPRALRAFEDAAKGQQIDIVAAPVGLVRDAVSTLNDWCPSTDGFARVRYAVYEWLGQKAGR